MAHVVMIGGGVVGLCGAMLLAQDGNEVTVLERDPASPPANPEEAWSNWERTGVNQFQMLHAFLPRFREVGEVELPEMVAALDAAGCLRRNPLSDMPAEFSGGLRPGDERYEMLTGRRPVVEAVIARSAAATSGVTIRRGIAVKRLVAADAAVDGIPHVVGVATADGEEIRGDLVIDAAGRRSSLPAKLVAIGARPPVETAEDSGFIYYARHFKSADGSLPFAFGPPLQAYDSISILALVADHGTWGVGVVASAKDAPIRAVRDTERFDAVVSSFPLVAHWLDAEPITAVDVMAKIEDRHRRFVVDGTPVATGVLALGDAWACTNPSVGRGVSIGLIHAVALRDLLRKADFNDARALAMAWDEATGESVAPYYDETLAFDQHRLAEIEAQIAGVPYETDDQDWLLGQALGAAALHDPDCLRGYLEIMSVLELQSDVMARPGLSDKAIKLGSSPDPAPGPSRSELLSILGT